MKFALALLVLFCLFATPSADECGLKTCRLDQQCVWKRFDGYGGSILACEPKPVECEGKICELDQHCLWMGFDGHGGSIFACQPKGMLSIGKVDHFFVPTELFEIIR